MIGPWTPPALARLGAERTRWDPGHTAIRWRVPEDPRFGNTAGTVHGGYLCVIADALLGSSLATLAGPDERSLNPDFHAEFLAPLPLGGALIGEGRVAQRGRTVSFLEATLRREEDGQPLLQAMSLGLMRPRGNSENASARSPEPVAERGEIEPAFAPDGTQLPLWFADFGARMLRFDNGIVEIEWPIDDHRFDNRSGGVQGGYLAFVADSAMGFALISGDGTAEAMATTTLSVHLRRPVVAGDTVLARATVDRQGRRFGFMRCELLCGDQTVASARATGLVRR